MIRMPALRNIVEGAAVLAVAVADQEAHALVGEVEAEVSRLLSDPGHDDNSGASTAHSAST
jgi:hypothetical protein